MNAPAISIPASRPLATEHVPAVPVAAAANRALMIGLAGLAVTLIGFIVSGNRTTVATCYLVGVVYWTAIAIGSLMLIFIHHVTDASWSVVIRRQWEHILAAFPWLGLLFAPLVLGIWIIPHHDFVWPWMDLSRMLPSGHTYGEDILSGKKSPFLNINMFTGMTVSFFLIWWWLSTRIRKASFSQDADGSPQWTMMNRQTSAIGLILSALCLTFGAFYWIMSLENHWFSTMYGVWFFANCMRGALSVGILIFVWLLNRGDYKGILNKNHLHSIGQLLLAFTIFWAYVTFAQYFLIWNANVPEETFWFNIREMNLDGVTTNQWWAVGLFILFVHFFLSFFLLLSYRFKVTPRIIRRIACLNLTTIAVDLCYNILPVLKDAKGDPQPFLSVNLIWVLTSLVGVGGICIWAYLRSFPTTKLIPIRDPRITECLTHHE